MRTTAGVARANDGDSGLTLDVTGRPRPELAFEVAAGGRLVLRQAGRVVLLALTHRDHAGVEYLTTGGFRSPLPPMRADHAATIAGAGSRWAHHFADALQAAPQSPLYDGRWLLTRTPRISRTPRGPARWAAGGRSCC